ncbi:MAG: hypothetical protein LBM87_00505 [Ruminococcus sp.]|jgi:hypothetical protein|nr:hypothetical protein [Ruminococcus sp.]
MTWFEDDSHQIPDYIKNMPRDELKKRIAEYDEQMRRGNCAVVRDGSLSENKDAHRVEVSDCL